jgi:hypothetical protein
MKTDKQKLIDSIIDLIPKCQQTAHKGNWVSSRFLARKRINELILHIKE